jgi:hypothetical protein
MTAKELRCLGIALKSLMKAKMYAEVEEVISVMAEEDREKVAPDRKE